MSGGHFFYNQAYINNIANQLSDIIKYNSEERDLSPETISKFKEAINALNRAYVYAHRIDWLLSGDDGEDSFHKRLASDLAELEKEEQQ